MSITVSLLLRTSCRRLTLQAVLMTPTEESRGRRKRKAPGAYRELEDEEGSAYGGSDMSSPQRPGSASSSAGGRSALVSPERRGSKAGSAASSSGKHAQRASSGGGSSSAGGGGRGAGRSGGAYDGGTTGGGAISLEMTQAGHRASCHRCGNLRKKNILCVNCPHIYCARCSEKVG